MAIEIAVSVARCVFSSIHSPRLSRSLSTSRLQALADNRDISCILGFLIFQHEHAALFRSLGRARFGCSPANAARTEFRPLHLSYIRMNMRDIQIATYAIWAQLCNRSVVRD
jgi:hypothetical protein